jgi:hypothetical protein
MSWQKPQCVQPGKSKAKGRGRSKTGGGSINNNSDSMRYNEIGIIRVTIEIINIRGVTAAVRIPIGKVTTEVRIRIGL